MANTPYSTTSTAGVGNIEFLSWHFNLADITAADMITDFVIPFAFKVVDIRAVATKAASTASKAATVTAKIDGTAVTGAAAALTTAGLNAMGKVVSATATDVLSGGNNIAYNAGSKLSVTASSVTAFVEGEIELVVTIQSLG